jgi:hypothetical protein
MNGKRYSLYLSDSHRELIEAIEKAGKDRGSQSVVFREALKLYFRTDQIAQELAGFERRMAAAYREQDRQMRRLRNELQILMAFFDLFVRSYYVHTPTVPAEAVEGAAASAKLRYENLLRQLPKVLQGSTAGLAGLAVKFGDGFET